MRILSRFSGLLLCGSLMILACGVDPDDKPDGGITDTDGGETDGGPDGGISNHKVVVYIHFQELTHNSAPFHGEMAKGKAAYFMASCFNAAMEPLNDPLRLDTTDGLRSTVYTMSGLAPSTKYYVQIDAFDTANKKVASDRVEYTTLSIESDPLFKFWKTIAEGRYKSPPTETNTGTIKDGVTVKEDARFPECLIRFGSLGGNELCLDMQTASVFKPTDTDPSTPDMRLQGKIHFCNPGYFDQFDEPIKQQFLAFVAQNPSQHPTAPHSQGNPYGCHDYSVQNASGEYVDGGDVDAWFVVEYTEIEGADVYHVVMLKVNNPE